MFSIGDISSLFVYTLRMVAPFAIPIFSLTVVLSMVRYLFEHGLDFDGKPIKHDAHIERTVKEARAYWDTQKEDLHKPLPVYHAENIHKHKCPYCGGNPGKGYSCRNCGAGNFWANTRKG